MLFLTNGSRRRVVRRRGGTLRKHSGGRIVKRSKRRPPKGFGSWRTYMASIRPNRGKSMARRRRRRRHRVGHYARRAAHHSRRFLTINRRRRRANPRRRRRRHNLYNAPRRRVRRRRNPFMRRHHRRRRYRRNPSIGGMIGQVRTAFVSGLHVMGGRVVSRAIPDLTGVSKMIAASTLTSLPATAALALSQIAAGLMWAYVVQRTFGQGAAAFALAGSMDGVTEDLMQGLSIPYVGQYLGNGGSMVTPMATAALRGYSFNADVASGATLGPGAYNIATGSPIARRALSGYSTPIGKGMVRRSGLGIDVPGYSY